MFPFPCLARPWWTAGLLWLVAAPVLAADPGTQEWLRQQERERILRQQQETAPDVRLPVPALPAPERLQDESPCFPVQVMTLQGQDSGQFQWALAAANQEAGQPDVAIGRCLGAKGINTVMRRIQNAIIERGFITTRILAEPQDLKAGELKLTVIPGRVRAVRTTAETPGRATLWNALPVRPGELLNLRDVEQGLENLKRIPTAEADIQIAPAEGEQVRPGESDLLVSWRQGFPFRVNLGVDDSGSKATGRYIGSTTVAYDHWWTLNDLFYASFNHDLGGGQAGKRGAKGYTVHYEVPYGYWLLGLTGSQYDYNQSVAGNTQDYVYSGTSSSSEIRLSRIVHRDALRKTAVYLRGWRRDSRNYIDDTEVEVQRRRMAGWETGVTHQVFRGSAVLNLEAGYRKGTGAMDALPAPEEAFDEGTSRPAILTASAQLSAPFALGPLTLRYLGTWRAQWNRTPLVPQDRFSIGGRYTVRGFDGESSLIGERGWLVRNDLGVVLGQSGQELYLGADYGHVGGPSTRYLLGRELAGVVLGLRGGLSRFSYDVFVGQPVLKPAGFQTPHVTAGFSANLSF
ncbi:ShlB/FhaC/HecB family hemolysin secretion/activation protein [Laribacter hongkongensis]|uniref:ShlB/FhaC/HecB family hemolysin secretion/activation protein n=1 Tax=Laribacter hongkongensis TaxID=168471 RepID=UPI001EFD8366|nr:ShlB/FhaC/HecB family hemolysin secretion/activation protein [Laribacter hongkongensis]MCG9060185.1 ShlB/FhaC/HecB family hemolysin secretion/activation protein [Laribacter hongkongensis]